MLKDRISILLGALGLNRTLNSLNELVIVAKQLSSKQFERSPHYYPKNKVGELAQELERTRASLKEHFEHIEIDKSQLNAVMSSMSDGVIALNQLGYPLFWNQAALTLLNHPDSLNKQTPLLEQLRIPEIHQLVSNLSHSPEPKQQQKSFILYVNPHKRYLSVQAKAVIIGTHPGVVIVIHDETKNQQIEQLRQEFTANASHELNTPITVIRGYVETLLDGSVKDKAKEKHFLQQILESTQHLTALTQDLLKLSKIEAKDTEPVLSAIAIKPNLIKIVNSLRQTCSNKGLTLKLDVAENITDKLAVLANEEGLQEIFYNLIDNAIKYTPSKGGITVATSLNENQIVVAVKDTGIGIAKHDLNRIFERFYRADKSHSKDYAGTGLGLAIVKHWVQRLNGNIEVESKVNSGSAFTVSLPLAAS